VRAGQTKHGLELLHDLRNHGPGVDNGIVASAMKICLSKHFFAECIMIYDAMSEADGFSVEDRSVWSVLLACAVELKSWQQCADFFDRLRAFGTPTQKEYWNMIRAGSSQQDWQLLVGLLAEMKDYNVPIDNVIYNTVLDCCVAAGQTDYARKLIEQLPPDQVASVITYNTLLKGSSKNRDLEKCNSARLSEWMRKRGIAAKDFERLGAEQSLSPDLASLSIIIKSYCDAGNVEAALEHLAGAMRDGATANELIFNTLLTGCAKQEDVELAKRVYKFMVASGLPPSNATFFIFVRLYKQCNLLEEAVELLRTEPVKHGVEVNPRVYSQLLQWCIHERKGKLAVEAYAAMVERCSPSANTYGWILGMCAKFRMFETAVDILEIAAKKGEKRIAVADAMAVMTGAARKGKAQCAEQVVVAMKKLGLPFDPAEVDM
jgi:pentatricopeptide repeat protein